MTTSLDEQPIELLNIGEPNNPLRLTISSFRGVRYLDIRRYYFDKVTKKIKPTTKGVALKEDESNHLLSFLNKNSESIQEYFIKNLDANELKGRKARKEKLAITNADFSFKKIDVSFDSWPGNSFYAEEIIGEQIKIILNTRNKAVASLLDDAYTAQEAFIKLLVSFIVAKKTLLLNKNSKPDQVIDILEDTWGKNLR